MAFKLESPIHFYYTGEINTSERNTVTSLIMMRVRNVGTGCIKPIIVTLYEKNSTLYF